MRMLKMFCLALAGLGLTAGSIWAFSQPAGKSLPVVALTPCSAGPCAGQACSPGPCNAVAILDQNKCESACPTAGADRNDGSVTRHVAATDEQCPANAAAKDNCAAGKCDGDKCDGDKGVTTVAASECPKKEAACCEETIPVAVADSCCKAENACVTKSACKSSKCDGHADGCDGKCCQDGTCESACCDKDAKKTVNVSAATCPADSKKCCGGKKCCGEKTAEVAATVADCDNGSKCQGEAKCQGETRPVSAGTCSETKCAASDKNCDGKCCEAGTCKAACCTEKAAATATACQKGACPATAKTSAKTACAGKCESSDGDCEGKCCEGECGAKTAGKSACASEKVAATESSCQDGACPVSTATDADAKCDSKCGDCKKCRDCEKCDKCEKSEPQASSAPADKKSASKTVIEATIVITLNGDRLGDALSRPATVRVRTTGDEPASVTVGTVQSAASGSETSGCEAARPTPRRPVVARTPEKAPFSPEDARSGRMRVGYSLSHDPAVQFFNDGPHGAPVPPPAPLPVSAAMFNCMKSMRDVPGAAPPSHPMFHDASVYGCPNAGYASCPAESLMGPSAARFHACPIHVSASDPGSFQAGPPIPPPPMAAPMPPCGFVADHVERYHVSRTAPMPSQAFTFGPPIFAPPPVVMPSPRPWVALVAPGPPSMAPATEYRDPSHPAVRAVSFEGDSPAPGVHPAERSEIRPGAQPPIAGTWEHESADAKIRFTCERSRIQGTAEIDLAGEDLEATMNFSGTCSVTPDGQLYGVIDSFKIDLAESEADWTELAMLETPMIDQPFAVRFRSDGESLFVKDFKCAGLDWIDNSAQRSFILNTFACGKYTRASE